MNNDVLLGFLVALPLYGIVLLLFKDIIIRGFIKRLIANSTTEVIGPNMGVPFTTEEFKDSVAADLLSSYKLFLILRDQFEFLERVQREKAVTPADKKLLEMYKMKMDDLSYIIEQTEGIFDEMGCEDYREIKGNVDVLLKNRDLF